MNKDPFSPIKSVPVSRKLSEGIQKSARRRINPPTFQLSFKYLTIFLTSGVVSLTLCPQWGYGLTTDFPLFHHIFHSSQILCGLYCGFIFFTTTHLLTFVLLNHFERVKIVKKASYLPVLVVSGIFAMAMLSNPQQSHFGYTYSFSWAFAVAAGFIVLNYLYGRRLPSENF